MRSGETELWQAVIQRALMDAALDYCGGRKAEEREIKRNKRDAISWLTGNSADYRAVCAMAGIEPDALREAYLSGKARGE